MLLKNAIDKPISRDPVRRRIMQRQLRDRLFALAGLGVMATAFVVSLALLGQLAFDGLGRVSWQFLTAYPSRFAAQAGILSAWIGTVLVMFLTALTAIPLGLGAAIYLEDYAPKNWVTEVIEINITNLAGVPSIVYGLMALGLLVYEFHLGQSFLTAGLTLAMLILPMVIIATREAIRAVPPAPGKVRPSGIRRHRTSESPLVAPGNQRLFPAYLRVRRRNVSCRGSSPPHGANRPQTAWAGP